MLLCQDDGEEAYLQTYNSADEEDAEDDANNEYIWTGAVLVDEVQMVMFRPEAVKVQWWRLCLRMTALCNATGPGIAWSHWVDCNIGIKGTAHFAAQTGTWNQDDLVLWSVSMVGLIHSFQDSNVSFAELDWKIKLFLSLRGFIYCFQDKL